ncbi:MULTISPECIES: DUF5695 domain-containing protein [unclassified Caulobacter]|uniref:DUF5695 domain-containing protein n=1 Tax=unclassified Caulobacter TaxID=2648921 RepID=UPI0007845A09|nr:MULTISPECIES: DUF5695 domain-containing protein [unclassified Caulobacter]AZS20015.1 hypothetical protein CSW63_04760 [Caulobacter sp. FWC26]
MTNLRPLALTALLLATTPLALNLATTARAQTPAAAPAKPIYAPIARTAYRTAQFQLDLRTDTQTLARLSPVGESAFDFVPGGREAERAEDGYVHVGDIHLRVRTPGGPWRDFSSAHQRRPIRPLPAGGAVLAAADITASLGATSPLRVERRWISARGGLALRFVLTNTSKQAVEVGGLGLPMVFDNIITDRSLEEAHAQASFVDPYIGGDAGYLQVTRLNGKGPALLVLPEKATPLEAYRPIQQAGGAGAKPGDIFTDRSKRAQTSEGFYDWTIASKAFAEQDWKGAGQPWNPPTSFTLAPGAQRVIGVRLVTSPSIRAIEDTLAAEGRPVAVGIPGYVAPTDQTLSLFLKSPKPVARIESLPAGALAATPVKAGAGWSRYAIRASGWGRATLSITYADGQVQAIPYFITKPLDQVMADLGRFSTTRQWFEDPADPFKRGPSVMTYDRQADRIVTQDQRVWIAGLSDEGGAGSWVAAFSKQLDNPDPAEVAKLERMVDETIVGRLQVADGPRAGAVRKSLFYYDPAALPSYYDPKLNWKTWASWSKKDSEDLGRSYNYPHVAIAHWVLYRLARNHEGLVRNHDWRWYLDHAHATVVAMMRDAPDYAEFGQMEGDVFVDILKDLRREGMTAQADQVEALMKKRADHWKTLPYPFGSEMAWDSTGQAEVYAWMRFFGHQPQADETREVILAYDPTLPSWGYNGNARRYWDFLYGGKVPRIERQIHHYGSTLNAVPLFDAYRANPADFHLLRVAYGGLMGGTTNIDQEGFSSAAFHSAPDMMSWDPYSGDYGMGFFGHAYAAATYLVDHPTFGWLGFGGDVSQKAGVVRIEPKDGARSRLFVAPTGAWLTLEAGKIDAAEYRPATGELTLTLAARDASTSTARLVVETATAGKRPYRVVGAALERGAYALPLASKPVTVVLKPN